MLSYLKSRFFHFSNNIFALLIQIIKMEKSKLVKSLLVISGIIGIIIGGSLLFIPVSFQATAGIDLRGNVSLLSEMRASGGAILVVSVLVMLGVFIAKLTFASVVLTCLFYLSYGVSRIFSIIIDGMPSESLIIATIVEMVIGLLSLLVLVSFREKQNKPVLK